MEKEIALVTGGGTGIGQAICEELANSNRYFIFIMVAQRKALKKL